ncbi:hypothetical protein RD792_009694 [Penstemon davidsonii]|uniref:F-box domain-containing protein n=1 Tax=Penstemon davidsonii TaxID=160366 RepID=A0ABR0CZS0_9LAMI|nr:hypothetical protein RD792_009694 [Penstemon davidsonii]
MANQNNETPPFSLLPEDWIAIILSFTSPKDAFRAAAVSKAFRSAASSDTLWELFLPSDYKNIIGRSVSPVTYSSKKELYLMLSDSPLLVDEGKLSIGLRKPSGMKCYMLCARQLRMAWKDDRRYWKWTSSQESRFSEVAELKRLTWLEIHGIMQAQMLPPNTNYTAYLVFKLTKHHYGLDCSSKAIINFEESRDEIGEGETSNVYIVPQGSSRREPIRHVDGRVSQNRFDGWMEIELGSFFVDGEEGYFHYIHMRLLSMYGWKKGLIVEGIEVRPKEVVTYATTSST